MQVHSNLFLNSLLIVIFSKKFIQDFRLILSTLSLTTDNIDEKIVA